MRGGHLRTIARMMLSTKVARTRDFTAAGVHRQAVRRAIDIGVIHRIGRGLYVGATRDDCADRMSLACRRVPRGVVCLLSALHFHGLVPETPEAVWMAIDRKARRPKVSVPALTIVRFSGAALAQGLSNLKIDGVPVRVYSPMKTIADCYKYREKIGQEVGRAAIQASVLAGKYSRDRLLHFAEICRVERIIRPDLPPFKKKRKPDRSNSDFLPNSQR